MTTPQPTCSKCKVAKPQEDFPKDKSRPNGYSYICKECAASKYRSYMADPANKARKRAKEAEFAALNPELRAKYQRTANLRRNYGIDADQWDAMFEAQDSRCKTCRSPEPGTMNGWATDHCHESGEVRGILCHQCNIVLGWFENGWEMPSSDTFRAYIEGGDSHRLRMQ